MTNSMNIPKFYSKTRINNQCVQQQQKELKKVTVTLEITSKKCV